MTSDEALAAGLKFLGTGYKEIGKSGSGVYHSADGTKEFRIDSGSIDGAHAPGVPHVHFGVKILKQVSIFLTIMFLIKIKEAK